jgi:hypothetical protein
MLPGVFGALKDLPVKPGFRKHRISEHQSNRIYLDLEKPGPREEMKHPLT